MNSYKLTVSSPDGNLYDGEALKLTVRGAEGDLAILAGHIPFVTSVKPGECRITLTDETEKTALTDGGILAVSSESVTLLSGSFRWKE